MLLSKFILAPWLLAQSKRVRANTIRLPEATGPREGKRHSEHHCSHTSVLVVGDSAAAGVGCETQDEAVCGQWIGLLEQRVNVHWQLVAQSSLTCEGVLNLLQETDIGPPIPIDYVLVSVGVNDVTRGTSMRKWRKDLAAFTTYLTQQLKVRSVIYTSLPPMHQFPALPQPLRWYVGQQARCLNQALQQHCERHSGCTFLDLDMPFDAKYMAEDGYHPAKFATKLWAKAAFEVLPNKEVGSD